MFCANLGRLISQQWTAEREIFLIQNGTCKRSWFHQKPSSILLDMSQLLSQADLGSYKWYLFHPCVLTTRLLFWVFRPWAPEWEKNNYRNIVFNYLKIQNFLYTYRVCETRRYEIYPPEAAKSRVYYVIRLKHNPVARIWMSIKDMQKITRIKGPTNKWFQCITEYIEWIKYISIKKKQWLWYKS